MIEPVLEDIKQYVYEREHEEACGLLSLERGKLKWNPCENKAENRHNDFIIDPLDYKKVSDRGDIVGVVHSHPYTTPNPSPMDRAACNKLGIPWYIFGRNDEWIKLEPQETSNELVGRPFVYGVHDCFTILQDYFEDLDIIVNAPDYEWEFWEKGKNLYIENFEKEGFIQVTDGSLQVHDVMLMALNSDVSNHAGIWKTITRIVVRHQSMV